MSEVIGSDEDSADNSWTDPYGDDEDGDQLDEATTPGLLRTTLTDPGALAVAALPLSLLSLFGVQLVTYIVNLLSLSTLANYFRSATAQAAWLAASGGLFALIGGGLGVAAVRRADRSESTSRWVRPLAGGAMIIAIVGLVLAMILVLVALAKGDPTIDNFGF